MPATATKSGWDVLASFGIGVTVPRFAIIQTNTTRLEFDAFDQKSKARIKKTVTNRPGRVIAIRRSAESMKKHVAKLRKCHREIEFKVIDRLTGKQVEV